MRTARVTNPSPLHRRTPVGSNVASLPREAVSSCAAAAGAGAMVAAAGGAALQPGSVAPGCCRGRPASVLIAGPVSSGLLPRESLARNRGVDVLRSALALGLACLAAGTRSSPGATTRTL